MRIVSLCPSLTELVFDLGRGRDLIGITRWCVHPERALREIEQVGGTKDPDLDRILELAPDLVLLNREENRKQDAETLLRAGIRCHVSMPRTTAETAEMVRSIGAAVDRGAVAEAIARRIEERTARAVEAARGRAPVPFAYLIWRKPWMAAAGDTLASSLLAQAGGRNVFSNRTERYPVIDTEELAAAAPDLVLLGSEPFPFGDRHIDELTALTGLSRPVFRLADGEYLSWHGSRTPDGIDYAVRLIGAARG